jgi:rRNA-processing protein FCF1
VRLLISDANILIDMEVGGLTATMFRLDGYRFAVPDVLFAEELAAQHPNLPGLGLEVLTLAADGVQDAQVLLSRHDTTGVSRMDILALALARQERCPLLTGDRRLREAAAAEGVEVTGTIWLVGELVRSGVVELEAARRAYDAMESGGRRLPWGEVKRQLAQFAALGHGS